MALQRTVGSLAPWLKRLSHGDDPREVKPDRPWKSISAETTYVTDLDDLQRMKAELGALANKVVNSLQKKNLLARTVTIKVRFDDFTTVTRSHSASPTSAAEAFAARAAALLERTDAARRPVRLLGVGAHGLEEPQSGRPEQLPLEVAWPPSTRGSQDHEWWWRSAPRAGSQTRCRAARRSGRGNWARKSISSSPRRSIRSSTASPSPIT